MAIESAFRDKLAHDPEAEYDAIVRTDGDAEPVARFCGDCGITVRRRFTLVPGLAVTGTGKDLMALADDARVTAIEPDREIHAQ
jgi:hypothetical protein